MISFIVPAHNEQALISRTLQAIHESARVVGEPYEIIVVDDSSTDTTAELARQHNARVVSVNHRQIAATRNSGGRAALGERFFFVDADTTINPRAVAAALRCMDRGAVGGGASVRMDGPAPLYISLISVVAIVVAKLIGFCGGAFMFCTREAFDASGGFDERLFWAEEGSLAFRLKRLGPFVVIWRPVLTSPRRLRTLSGREGLAFLRAIFRPTTLFTSRESVKGIWYDSSRAGDDIMPNSPRARLSNTLLLLITLSVITGPIWNFIPWSQTPLATPLGKFRFVNSMFLCHAGLILWPFAIVLFWNLLKQTWNREWIRLAALTTVCSWQAWECSVGAIKIWARVYHWIA